jgi:hypothetical protein
MTQSGLSKVRDLTISDADLLADFFNHHWRRDHIFWRRRDLLLWLYHGNPVARELGLELTCKVLVRGGELVSLFAFIPFALNDRGNRRIGCYLSAWWTAADHRSGPTALILLNELQRSSHFSAWISGMNTAVAEKLYEKMSWNVVRNIPRMVLPLDHERLHAWGVEVERSPPATPVSVPGVLVKPINDLSELDGEEWDAFFWKRFAPSVIGPAREYAYLSWRYQLIPIFRYRFLVATGADGLAGLLVFRVEIVRSAPEKIVRIVDLVCTEPAADPLIAAAVAAAGAEGAVLADVFFTQPVYAQAFRRYGFVADDGEECYRFPYLFQPLDLGHRRLNCAWRVKGEASEQQLFLMKGDYEFDRPT